MANKSEVLGNLVTCARHCCILAFCLLGIEIIFIKLDHVEQDTVPWDYELMSDSISSHKKSYEGSR